MLSGFIYTLVALNALSVAAVPLSVPKTDSLPTDSLPTLPNIDSLPSTGSLPTTDDVTKAIPANLKSLVPTGVDASELSVVQKQIGPSVATIKGVVPSQTFDFSVVTAMCCTNPKDVIKNGADCAPAKCVMAIVSFIKGVVSHVVAQSNPDTGAFDLKDVQTSELTGTVTPVTAIFQAVKVDQVAIGLKDTVSKATTDAPSTGSVPTLIAFVQSTPNVVVLEGFTTVITDVTAIVASPLSLSG
ncbi:hypothetical protein AA313_de0201687 [Arthrobotrys entomopaga]|nr:hypothetical protein AA313_de0201687 [Arthrobotrys entomopaga]